MTFDKRFSRLWAAYWRLRLAIKTAHFRRIFKAKKAREDAEQKLHDDWKGWFAGRYGGNPERCPDHPMNKPPYN